MPAITSLDLSNAKLDVDHIATIATSTAQTASDRLGTTKYTVTGAIDTIKAFTNRGVWAVGINYVSKDLVNVDATWYVCVVQHTSSSSFATDADSKWRVYQGITTNELFPSTGSSLIGWIQSAANSVLRTISDKLLDQKSIFDFMTIAQIYDVRSGTGSLDLSVPLQKARDYIAGALIKPKLVFPAGVYRYTVSPNWAIQNGVFIPEGIVRLRYAGTGDAVILDGGITGGGVYNTTFGTASNKFIVEAPSSAGHGVLVRSVHHGHVGVKVTGCGSTSAGVKVIWCVCTDFYVTVSANEEGWYLGAKPKYGLYLDKRGAGETTSYCNFWTPVIEYPDTGIFLAATLGNSFFGGTSEGCPVMGIYASSESSFDKFWGVDLEANTQDVVCFGSRVDFVDCDTATLFQIAPGATFTGILGGTHHSISVDAGSAENLLSNLFFNRAAGGGSVTDNGTNTKFQNVFNLQTRKNQFAALPPPRSVTVTSSPFTYTNSSDKVQGVVVSGGVVSTVQYSRSGGSVVIGSIGMWDVCPGDSLIVTYSSAPSVLEYQRNS